MENQSGQVQDYMADQRIRSWLATQSTAQQHAGSSSNPAVIQVPALPSHTDYVNIEPPDDDGYNWRMCGKKIFQGGCYQKVYYECAQSNCRVEKSVTRSTHDGQAKKTIYKGSHNHPRSSERWLRDDSATADAMTMVEMLQAAESTRRPSVAMPRNEEEGEQPSGSSDSEEEDDSEARVEGGATAGDVNAVERHDTAAADWITVQTATEVDVLGNGCQRPKNCHRR